jgi:signal transduction histidine kinase
VSQAWECQQGYFEDEPAPVNFKVDHKKPTNRLDAWRSHMTANFSRSLVGKLINGNLEKFDLQKDLVYYTETDNKPLGINARSEAVLALRDSASKELIGVFDLIFNQHPGLEFDRQRPLLEGAARFAGEYLSIRRRNRQYLTNSQIMRQQAALGDAYQQLRHSLKIHLMGLNGKLSRLLLAIENLSANQETAKSLAKKMQYILTQISSSIDMSKVLVNPPNPVDLDLSETWNAVREKLLSTAEKSGVDIPPMQDSVKVYLDHATLEMVFTNMLGNAFEAMATQETPRRVECVILPTVKPGFVRVSVRDTGPGVPDSIKSKLFKEIGVSQKSSGTGFQTYFSAFKLEQSGGHIEHDLDWKQGAGFLLTLPQTKESYQKIIKES